MKPRIAAICAIVTIPTCVGGAPDQFPDCAYITLFNPAQSAPKHEEIANPSSIHK